MSKDTDKDLAEEPGTHRARRRKKSGLRIPSDNVPRTVPMEAVSEVDAEGAGDEADDGVVTPVPEDPNVAVAVAYAFGPAEASDEQDGRNQAAQAQGVPQLRDEDLDTRKTTQMPAISLEELGLVAEFDVEEDGEAVDIDIDEEPEDVMPGLANGSAVRSLDEAAMKPSRTATVALSDEDLEEYIESAEAARARSAPVVIQPRARRADTADEPVSLHARHTQPVAVLSETALAAYVGDDDDDDDFAISIASARAGSKQRRAPEPGVPAAVAALEDAGVESPYDTPLTFGDASDSGEILSDDLIEEVDDSDVDVEDQSPKAPPPAPPAVAQVSKKPPPAPRSGAKASNAQARPKRRKGKPWFEEIFDEDYLRTLPFLTPQATQAEAAFVASALELETGSQIIDIGCGYGRHAMELAARGYQVVALDLSLPLLLRGADEAQRRGLNINFVHGDMRDLSFDGQFDGAYCLFSTFGYFDEDANLNTARGIARSLKPGGRLVIEILNRDYLIADLPARVWWEGDGCVVLEEVDFNYYASRVVSRRSVVFDDGRQLEQEISMRAYSLHEFGKLLHTAGFRVIEISGSMATRGRFFGNQSRELIVVAARREDDGDHSHQFARGGTSSDSSALD